MIYPIASHWVFGGGWLQANIGMQDFAGSTAVHMIGATGALAVLLQLGAAPRQVRADGKPRAIPGHNMPLFGLGVLILWLGWFGFNPGSTLNALDGRFAEVALVTHARRRRRRARRAAHRVCARRSTSTSAWPATARSARSWRSRRPSGYVEPWARDRSASIAGVIVAARRATRSTRSSTIRSARSPRTASAASGARCPAASSRRRGWPQYNAVGEPGLLYSGSFHQLGRQALGIVVVFAFVFVLSYAAFWAIKKTYGLRVTAEEEDAGLDISEHGMYGYPEQFIPAPELVGYTVTPGNGARSPACRRRHPQRRCPVMKKVEAFIRHEAFEPIRMELLSSGSRP